MRISQKIDIATKMGLPSIDEERVGTTSGKQLAPQTWVPEAAATS